MEKRLFDLGCPQEDGPKGPRDTNGVPYLSIAFCGDNLEEIWRRANEYMGKLLDGALKANIREAPGIGYSPAKEKFIFYARMTAEYADGTVFADRVRALDDAGIIRDEREIRDRSFYG